MNQGSTKRPEDWTDEEVFAEIGKIVVKFPLLQCDRCAKAVMEWVETNGIDGKILKLRTKNIRQRYILSDRIGENESITENGQHYGVEVRGRIFDNLSPEGLLKEDWLKDFSCSSGQFIVEELEEL